MINPSGAFVWAFAFGLLGAVAEGQEIHYHIAFTNRVHHEAQVTLTISGLDPRGAVEFRMSRSSPGRYAIHEFGKNVYGVRADDGAQRPLSVHRPNPYQWDVGLHDGTVRVTYTLFGDRADGTYTQIDATHAHLNMPATFMWARGLESIPITVTFSVPDDTKWNVATQLHPTNDPRTFTAPGLQYFMDSPTELSEFALREWEVRRSGRTGRMRLAVHHIGTDAEVDGYAEMVRRVVDQEVAVFGEMPAFDGGTYTFIADYLPWASGDGMEHRNSTILSSSGSLARSASGLIGTVAHEFFHSWNVERIRPRSLEPFDFERANMSGELWLAEGFTSYYGPLILARAGITPLEQYASALAGALNAVIQGPGRAFLSPVEMSMQAPFVDAATAIDPTNGTNTFISYYTWGSVLGLGLDLTLRSRFDKTLDGYMRLLWERHGRTEIPYTIDDLERALADYAANSAFAHDFFARYVHGREVPDFAELLSYAGLLLGPASPEASFLGLVNLDYGAEGATLVSGTQIGSPFYVAGLDRGDRIITLDGRPLVSDGVWQAVKSAHRPGDRIAVDFESRGTRKQATIVMSADPRLGITTYEDAGRTVTSEIRAFRASWLGKKE